jgi:hypothetical protein
MMASMQEAFSCRFCSAAIMYGKHLGRESMSRDIQRLLRTLFPLEMRKEYFDCPERDSHAEHYI